MKSKLFFYVLTIPSFILMMITACDWLQDPEERGPAPSDCVETAYDKGYLYIRCTINRQNDSVPIYVFYGRLRDKNLDTFFYSKTSMITLVRPLGEYSVVAEYIRNRDTIVVFDGDDIDVKETEYSDKSCWSLENARVDVQLKF